MRGRAAALGLDPGNFLENTDLHVHVPAGAVPKDGPSAGITMYTALVSLFTGIPIRPDVAMSVNRPGAFAANRPWSMIPAAPGASSQ